MSIASLGGEKKLSMAGSTNVMLPRMLQRRFAVSSESSRPGTFDDDKFVIQSYPKSQSQRARIQEILSGILLFQGVTEMIMKDLIGGFYEIKYNHSEKIIVQGDIIADKFFLLESGQCDIFVQKGSADPVKVHTVLPGGFFGELALLYNAPRAATVISNGESKLWALDRGTFKNCMARASKMESSQDSNSNLLKSTPKPAIVQTQLRGSLALMDEQVMKALDQKSKDSVKLQSVPDWHTIVNMSINNEKFYQMLFKFSHPHISLYKLSDMDPTNLQTLIHPDVEPRHFIFLPMCKLMPTATPNTVALVGHHLDGTITFKFKLPSELSKFLDISEKSREVHSKLDKAYQNVRYASAGGIINEIDSNDSADATFYGVGLYIDISKNGSSLTVRDIVPGSPAAACGLISPHDHLIKIDGLSAKHSCPTLEDVVKLIRGVRGTQVKLQFRKSSGSQAKSIYEVILVRGPNSTADASLASIDENVHQTSISGTQESSQEEHEPRVESLFVQQAPIVFQSSSNDVDSVQITNVPDKLDLHQPQLNVQSTSESNEEHLMPHEDTKSSEAGQQRDKYDDTLVYRNEALDAQTLDNSDHWDQSNGSIKATNPKQGTSNTSSRSASKISSRSESPFVVDDANRSNKSRLHSSSFNLMREIAREEISRRILEENSQSQDRTKLFQSTRPVSNYIQAFRAATSNLNAHNTIQRPVAQVFTTNMGITLMCTLDNRYQVHSIASNAPSSVSHVCIGDLLLAVDHEPATSKSIEEIRSILSQSMSCHLNHFRADTDVHLSLCRNGINIYIIVRRHVNSISPSVSGPLFASSTNTNSHNQIFQSSRSVSRQSSPRISTRANLIPNVNDIFTYSLSSGFSVSKSSSGLVAVTNIISSEIRRMEVGDVVTAVDGHIISSEDTFDDVINLLEEPAGTMAQVTLLRDSGGTAGIMRKSTHFLRKGSNDRNSLLLDANDRPQSLNRSHRNGSKSMNSQQPAYLNNATALAFAQRHRIADFNHHRSNGGASPEFPNHSHFSEEDDYHSSGSSTVSTCTNSMSSSFYNDISGDSGVGLVFGFRKTSGESQFYVNYIMPNSPALNCGQINVGDKLIKINGRLTSAEANLESFLRHMAGPEGSQVTLKFVKPNSGMKYTITLTRSPVPSQRRNESPIAALMSDSMISSVLPFQVLPVSEPTFAPAKPPNIANETIETAPVSLTDEKSSTFTRIRAERSKSIDFNAAFRKKVTTSGDSMVAPPASIQPRSTSIFEKSFQQASSQNAELISSRFAEDRAARQMTMDFNGAFRKKVSVPLDSFLGSRKKFSFKEMFFPSKIGLKQVQNQ